MGTVYLLSSLQRALRVLRHGDVQTSPALLRDLCFSICAKPRAIVLDGVQLPVRRDERGVGSALLRGGLELHCYLPASDLCLVPRALERVQKSGSGSLSRGRDVVRAMRR